MQIPGLAGRPVPRPAVVAVALLAVAGCGLLAAALLVSRGDAAVAVAASATATRSPRTPVPTILYTRTPLPTSTDTATAIPTPTEPPTETATAEASETPPRAATATQRPATRAATVPAAATIAPPATGTPTQAAAVSGGGRGMTGQLSLCNPKPSYAAKSDTFEGERICVNELITNATGGTVTYGVLGVRAENVSGGQSAFQTSWRGQLSVPPGGNGPTGGGWQDGLYLPEGSYVLRLSICYSDVDTCLSGGGDWETLTPGIAIQVVPWTP